MRQYNVRVGFGSRTRLGVTTSGPSFYMLGSVPVLKMIVTGMVVGTIRYEKKNVYLGEFSSARIVS